MYSLQLLRTPARCASGCGTVVKSRLAGHYFQDPMCHSCFEQAAPELAAALGLRPTSLQLLESRLEVTCAQCGDRLEGRRIAGHHLGDPTCRACFEKRAPELTALLLLEDAAVQAAERGRDAQGLLKVAINYARRLRRRNAERRREPLKPKADKS